MYYFSQEVSILSLVVIYHQQCYQQRYQRIQVSVSYIIQRLLYVKMHLTNTHIISVFNALFALIIFVEISRVCQRFPICKYITSRECDTEFIVVYLLRKKYMPIETELTSLSLNLQQCVDYYKNFRANSEPKANFDDLYINLLIHTERAAHRFSKHMERHEIYDVYMKVLSYSICLEKIEDLFNPNEDTDWEFPRKILVIGRPGIGKTVLTEKIVRDWTKDPDEFYHDKIIAFYFKFRWFSANGMNKLTLKSFLCYGTELAKDEFEKVYEEITKHPEKQFLFSMA